MAAVVSRLMVIAPPMAPTTPAATEEL
jgi:hypothetical protein